MLELLIRQVLGVKNLRKIQKFYSVSSQPFWGKDLRIFFCTLYFYNCFALLFTILPVQLRSTCVCMPLARFLHVPHASKQCIYIFSNVADWFISYQPLLWRPCPPVWGCMTCPPRVVPARCMLAFKIIFEIFTVYLAIVIYKLYT